MRSHPYLRAYMAGITLPTMFLMIAMTLFTLGRYIYDVAAPVERIIVFPMAIVPNAWGVWNMLYVRLRSSRSIPIGLYGALLPLLIAPLALTLAALTHFPVPPFVLHAFPIGLPITMIVYYLVWKHIVGFFNGVLGVA